MRKYDKADAIAILGSYHHGMADIRDDGVWPSDAFVEGNVLDDLSWNYAIELNWPGAPNPLIAPSLPIPFSAHELAAFMLDGIGAMVPATYLDWHQGLDEAMLQRMGIRAARPIEALWAAYLLLRDAEVVVGEHPSKLEHRAESLDQEIEAQNAKANVREGVFAVGITIEESRLRRSRAEKSLVALKRKGEEVRADYQFKFAEWRRAMVRHLIRPPEQTHATVQPHPTISLPPGTQKVNIVDIPNLISETLYCSLLAEGRFPEGTPALPDDEHERLRSVQLYKLAQTHTNWMSYAIKTGRLVPVSRLSGLPCGIDNIADAYVSVDAFKAYVTNSYDGIEVQTSTGIAPAVAAESNVASEDATPLSRLAALRKLGGDVSWKRMKWKISGITLLVQQERLAGNKRSSQKTIRKDLKEAADAESLEKKRQQILNDS